MSMKPSYVLNFFGLKAQNVLNMFLISLHLKCAMISQKNDNCSEKGKFWLSKLQVLEIIIRTLFKHYFNIVFYSFHLIFLRKL